MYLREIKGKTKNYLAIVEGTRDPKTKKVKQKMVCNLGSINEINADSMRKLGQKLLETFGGAAINNANELAEESRNNWGAAKIVDSLMSTFAIDSLFKDLLHKRKLKFDLLACLKLMLASRLCAPCSKLKTFNNQQYYQGIADVELENLYRCLDELHTYQDDLKRHLFAKQKQFCKDAIDVVFFDVTTLYFESKNCDNLKNFGFSKDCKFNDVQIVLSLIVDKQGRPLSYGLFPGNTFEGNSLLPCLLELKQSYNINKVIIVADRGMCSFDNLEAIVKAGFDYIVGAKLRGFDQETKAQALDGQGYQTLIDQADNLVKYKLINHQKRKGRGKHEQILEENLACIWSSKRARKDSKDRQKLVEKATDMVHKKSLQDKRGAKKYLNINTSTPTLDEQKIVEDRRWDGYYAISSNNKDLTVPEIVQAYHCLWTIEESFRTLKSHFEARPLFHWTEKRIHGHIMLNFIAMVIEKHILIQLKDISQDNIKPTHQYVREAIAAMEVSNIKLTKKGKALMIYSQIDDLQRKILSLAKVSIPKNIIGKF